MPGYVVLVHGWSADASSMYPLRDFLTANGYAVTDILLSQYVSMDDDVRVEDVAKRMAAVLDGIAATTPRFDMIVHSTGGLVVRDWITRARPEPWACPVKRLLMLAPANFGSRLASAGKSFVGRVVKGWDNWFESGQERLNALELASDYQWRLAERDLVSRDGPALSPYGPGKTYAFIIVGSRGHTGGLEQITNEDGSDGVVRPSAANLNIVAVTVDFSTSETDPEIRPWSTRQGAEAIPIAILPDRNHGSILQPQTDTGFARSDQLGKLILQAMACDDDATYQQIQQDWDAVTADTASLAEADDATRARQFSQNCPSGSTLTPHMQVIVRVRDDAGHPVTDFFLEFFSPQTPGTDDTVLFQRCVLKDIHPNSLDPSIRCLFIDRDALFKDYYQDGRTSVALSLSAAKIGANIRYFDATAQGAAGHLMVHCENAADRAGLEGRLYRNQTHLVEIIVPRQPIDTVFAIPPP